ncbi:MAG: DsbA family protein [Acidobacteriaceae bacterium]
MTLKSRIAYAVTAAVFTVATFAYGQATAAKPAEPAAPAPQLSNLNPFPPPNPKFFTAASPTVDTVNSFLKQLWGYDPNREWQVEAILKTPAEGVSKVVVYVAQRGAANNKPAGTQFFVLPDGKHAIAGTVIPFGATPFADARKILQERADGPAHGSASKDLMLVEFSDLECPHCKEAQATMNQLVKDFPGARIVYENFPLVSIHPEAFKAAAYGVCVAQKSNSDFFQYVQAVFDTQEGLTPAAADTTLNNAVTKVGLDSATIAACANTQATKDAVNASIKLGDDLYVDSTPTLFVNGRPLEIAGIPYETLKQIINFQAVEDGVSTGAAATPVTSSAPPSLR